MKKIISLLLAVVLVSGCGKSSVLPSSDVLSLSKLPPAIPPPADWWKTDIKPPPDITMTFWDKVQLITVSVTAIIFCGYLYYVNAEFKRVAKLFERSAELFKRSEIEFACQKVRLESQVEEQKRHAGHQTNHPVYPIVHSDD